MTSSVTSGLSPPTATRAVDLHEGVDHHECIDLLLPAQTTNNLVISSTQAEMPHQVHLFITFIPGTFVAG
ncbi:unnamed protein product [Gongylonema pulchrum]|uniref:Uncharacterized protein n=1 Tax=Gongylonema pulchrum TaxID=637853 RepID=A0A183CZJ3_9BILA|nr:unnamed protein product [Gongylonema pulchrum]